MSVVGPAPLPPIIQLRGVRAGYDEIEVLHDIDLTVTGGEVLAVLGPNGAGKSTLLQVIAGLVRPIHGDVDIMGQSIVGADAAELARIGLCLVPEGRGVFPNLTVAENLWLTTGPGRNRRDVEAQTFEVFPALQSRRRQLAGSLSGGEQQMLAMARAIVTDPALVLLDELSMGLAPRIVAQLYEIVAQIAEAGTTVIVVEQFVRTVLGIADRTVVLAGGRVVLAGTPDEVAPQLQSAYLVGSETKESSP